MRKPMGKKKFILIPLLAAAFISLVSLAVMQLWNHLLPEIIHVSAITFWQAMGLFLLCKLLFGFGSGAGGGGYWMKHKLRERFTKMDPEERERFRAEMEERMCGWKRPRAQEEPKEV